VIEYLRGKLLVKDPDHILMEVNGVGYGLDIPLSTYNVLPRAGDTVELFVYTFVRDEAFKLFGFQTEEERDIFEVLINTSGIGPKMSLGIMSSLSIGDFASAVLNKDLAALTRIPGIGKKTAERLVVELKDKMERFSFKEPEAVAKIGDAARQRIHEAVAALESLGCKPYVASRAVAKAHKIVGEDAPLESLIKEALKHR
jgi:Holliday junction DNA helicase RuvA